MRLLAMLCGLQAATAFAHPGAHHDSLSSTLIHWLTELDHLALVGVGVLIVFSLRRQLGRRTGLQREQDDDAR